MSVGVCYAGTISRKPMNAGITVARVPAPAVERQKLRMIAPAAALFLVLCFMLAVRIAIIQEGYRLESLRNTAMTHDQALRQYRMQYAFLTSPQRVTGQARERLGMVPTRPQQLRRIS